MGHAAVTFARDHVSLIMAEIGPGVTHRVEKSFGLGRENDRLGVVLRLAGQWNRVKVLELHSPVRRNEKRPIPRGGRREKP